MGVSILTNCSPIYISELVPAHVRARAVGLTVAGAGATSVIATVVVWATSKYTSHWQYSAPLAVQAALPVTFAILALLLTESPTWLVSHGRRDAARENLILLRGGNTAQAEREMCDIDHALCSTSEGGQTLHFWEILNRKNIQRTLIASAFISLGQVGGQILIGTYSTVILVQSGVADPFKITIIIFLLQFVGTIVGPTLLDKIGRRPVALVGFSLILIMDIIAGVLACVGLKTQPQRTGLAALCIILSFANAASFQSM
jgi:MFS family permease